MAEVPQRKFHGKVLVKRGDTEIHVNVFDDNREIVYLEIAHAIAQFSPDIKPATAAQRAITRAEQARAAAPGHSSAKAAPTKPACALCGRNDKVELISWSDQATGEVKKAWKCQRCKRWLTTKNKQPAEEYLPY